MEDGRIKGRGEGGRLGIMVKGGGRYWASLHDCDCDEWFWICVKECKEVGMYMITM